MGADVGSESGNWAMANGKIHTPPTPKSQEHRQQNSVSTLLSVVRGCASECGMQRLWSRLRVLARENSANVKDWMRRSGPLKVAVVGAVGLVGVVGLVMLVTFLVLFVSAAANAILISFILSVTLVGFLMASFFTSLTAVYVGALWAVGATISALTFCSICGMIVAAGWFTFSWGVWNFLHLFFQRLRASAATLKSVFWNNE